jgi:hypothetical protein
MSLAIGTGSASAPPSDQAISPARIEQLTQTLARAAGERRLSQADFDRLHAGLIAHDAQGIDWSFGLRERRWQRGDANGWAPARPPAGLSVSQATLAELTQFETYFRQSGRKALRADAARLPPRFGELARAAVTWLKKNVFEAVVYAVFGAAMGYILGWFLPVLAGWTGSDWLWSLASGSAGSGESGQPGLMLPLLSALFFALIGYWRSAGTKRLLTALARFPASVASLFRAGGGNARVHLLWGAGLAFLVSVAISPGIGALVGLALALSVPSLLGGIVSSLLFRLWSAIARLVSPVRKAPLEGAVMFAIGLAGSALALLLGTLLDGGPVSMVFALACLGLALVLGLVGRKESQPDPPPPGLSE